MADTLGEGSVASIQHRLGPVQLRVWVNEFGWNYEVRVERGREFIREPTWAENESRAKWIAIEVARQYGCDPRNVEWIKR